jgi:hypothetical protein
MAMVHGDASCVHAQCNYFCVGLNRVKELLPAIYVMSTDAAFRLRRNQWQAAPVTIFDGILREGGEKTYATQRYAQTALS